MTTCMYCGAWLDEDPHFEDCKKPKENFLFFIELKIGQKFTYILWQQGEVEFQKTDIHVGVRKSTQEPYEFHGNDLVRLIDESKIS